MKIKASCSSEISVFFQITKRRQIPEDRTLVQSLSGSGQFYCEAKLASFPTLAQISILRRETNTYSRTLSTDLIVYLEQKLSKPPHSASPRNDTRSMKVTNTQ
jgi:hypothetical protein